MVLNSVLSCFAFSRQLFLSFMYKVVKVMDVLTEKETPSFSCRDGKISLQELISAVGRLQNAPSEEKCQRIAEILDQDQDGTLDLGDVERVCNKFCYHDQALICLKTLTSKMLEYFNYR